MTAHPTARARIDGLDLARYLALVGMVIVNFSIVMGADNDTGWAHAFAQSLSGRAAATFVVLAGIGLGLARHRDDTMALTLRRAVFLGVIGCLNMLIFPADILHYYAVYFVIGALCLRWSARRLLIGIAIANAVFLVLLFTLDYDAGWNWTTLDYSGFWTPSGFVRNLFFNGWHPVFPWVGFLLLGLALSWLDLRSRRVQWQLAVIGGVGLVAVELCSGALVEMIAAHDPEAALLAATDPIPPTPLYTLAGSLAAMAVTGVCLLCTEPARRFGLLALVAPAGRQTLTLYVAHIVLGMGTLEALNLIGGQSATRALMASLLFCALATLLAWLWSRVARRGPIEMLMRRLAG